MMKMEPEEHATLLRAVHVATGTWRNNITTPHTLLVNKADRVDLTQRAQENGRAVWPVGFTGLRMPVITK